MPVAAPHIVCVGCARPTSLWAPLCPTCQSIVDARSADELSPVVGERYRDALEERRLDQEEISNG